MGLVCAVLPSSNRLITFLTALSIALIASIFVGVRIRKHLLRSWDYRLGAKGEQVVGSELDRLMAQGYQVFHDVPFEGWNIDHVVVGPRGVFAVETKAWRKPVTTGIKAEIVFDGQNLSVPGRGTYAQPIAQATRNAESLAKWITKVAAETVPVVPVVAFPGWKVSIQNYGEVAVFSATNMSDHLPKRGKSSLTPEQIQRIAFHLQQRCTVESPKG